MNPNEELENEIINPEEIPNNVFESDDAEIINLEEIDNLTERDYTEINPDDIPDNILD